MLFENQQITNKRWIFHPVIQSNRVLQVITQIHLKPVAKIIGLYRIFCSFNRRLWYVFCLANGTELIVNVDLLTCNIVVLKVQYGLWCANTLMAVVCCNGVKYLLNMENNSFLLSVGVIKNVVVVYGFNWQFPIIVHFFSVSTVKIITADVFCWIPNIISWNYITVG